MWIYAVQKFLFGNSSNQNCLPKLMENRKFRKCDVAFNPQMPPPLLLNECSDNKSLHDLGPWKTNLYIKSCVFFFWEHLVASLNQQEATSLLGSILKRFPTLRARKSIVGWGWKTVACWKISDHMTECIMMWLLKLLNILLIWCLNYIYILRHKDVFLWV